MDIIDAARRTLFGQMYDQDGADAEAKAKLLRRIGLPGEQIAGFCRPGIHAGMTLGGSHLADVRLVVEQVLERQRAGSVTIRVARDRHAGGHLWIEIVEVGPPDSSQDEAAVQGEEGQ